MWYKNLIIFLLLCVCFSQYINAQKCPPSYEVSILLPEIDLDEATISLQNDKKNLYIKKSIDSKEVNIYSFVIENQGSKNNNNDSITSYEILGYKILPNNTISIFYSWDRQSYFNYYDKKIAHITIRVVENSHTADDLPVYHLTFTHTFCETKIHYKI